MNNYYETLGIKEDADPAEIKKAHRKLALRWHPDKNPDNKEAEEHFKKIQNAFDHLKDKVKRAAHDVELERKREAEEQYIYEKQQQEWAQKQPSQREPFPWFDVVLGVLALIGIFVLVFGGGKGKSGSSPS